MARGPAQLAGILALAFGSAAAAPADVFQYGHFGQVSIYKTNAAPSDVVLLISGDSGWDAQMSSMAGQLTAKGAVVAGIDIRTYLAQSVQTSAKCVSAAGDLESLSRYFQSKLGVQQYLQPALVGYAAGGTLVQATYAQASEGMFKGALSVGTHSALNLHKPLCPGGTRAGSWVEPPQLDAAYERMTAIPARVATTGLPASVADLPLTVVPAVNGKASPWFAVFLSGDGGWVGVDRGVSKELAKHGIPIVGWDSLKYFGQRARRRAPPETSTECCVTIRAPGTRVMCC